MAEPRRLVLQWPRFGPYHLARIDAVHAHFAPRGVEVVGLETAAADATYAWRPETTPRPWQRVQVFPEARFDALPPARVHAAVVARLEALQPEAVVINSYSFPDARACLAWCRHRRRTAVVVTDSKADDAPRRAWRERLKGRLVRQFDAALLAGTPHRAYFEQLGFPPEAIFLGCDVVDNAFFREGAEAARRDPATRALPGLSAAAPFFLAVSRLLPHKNVDGLLAAYAQYRAAAAAPWRLVVVGDGPERARLESQAGPGVTFAGFQQIDALPAYYGHAAAFVLPSFKDTWGLVVNEAMAAGLPVLVSARAGCAHDLVAEGENGFRFDPARPEALAALMARVAALPEEARAAMGARSQALIAHWSPARFARSLDAALAAGAPRSRRPFDPVARALLAALRLAARRADSFHTADA